MACIPLGPGDSLQRPYNEDSDGRGPRLRQRTDTEQRRQRRTGQKRTFAFSIVLVLLFFFFFFLIVPQWLQDGPAARWRACLCCSRDSVPGSGAAPPGSL